MSMKTKTVKQSMKLESLYYIFRVLVIAPLITLALMAWPVVLFHNLGLGEYTGLISLAVIFVQWVVLLLYVTSGSRTLRDDGSHLPDEDRRSSDYNHMYYYVYGQKKGLPVPIPYVCNQNATHASNDYFEEWMIPGNTSTYYRNPTPPPPIPDNHHTNRTHV